jgi:hypothetical protein
MAVIYSVTRCAEGMLSDDIISDYEAVIPVEWSDAVPFVQEALGKIRNARDNIVECANEVQRVLKC